MRRGERVLAFDSWDQLDLARLRTLIESSFGRTLAADYFERTQLMRAYVSENYRAAVILLDADLLDAGKRVYLDKFAVLDDAQGEGLGRAVWQVMRDETPHLFWRSRHGNIINHFYYAESDGSYKLPNFKAFWFGIDAFDEIEACIDYCREKAPTLIDREPAVVAEQAV